MSTKKHENICHIDGNENEWAFKRTDSSTHEIIESCAIRVDPQSRPPVIFTDDQIRTMTESWSSPVIGVVPGLRYWELGENRKMCYSENITGHQQRAFDWYWTLALASIGQVVLGIGTSTAVGPNAIGTDYYCGTDAFGKEIGYPHIKVDAEAELPFFTKTFGGVMANHVIEHLHNQELAVAEWLRVTRKGGYVMIITPDMTFSARGCVDKTHVREWGCDAFFHWLTGSGGPRSVSTCPDFDVIEYNTLDNRFSFNAVLLRK